MANILSPAEFHPVTPFPEEFDEIPRGVTDLFVELAGAELDSVVLSGGFWRYRYAIGALLAAYDLYVTSLTRPDARELSWIFASSTPRDARAHRDVVRALIRAPHMEAARRVILPTAQPDHLAHSTRLTGASLDEDARDCASFTNARRALRLAHPGRKHCGLVWMTRHKVVSCDPRTRVVRLPLNLGVGRSDHAAWVIFVNQEAPRLTRDLGEALEAACSAAPPGREVQVYPIPEGIVGDFQRDMPAAIQKHLGLLAV